MNREHRAGRIQEACEEVNRSVNALSEEGWKKNIGRELKELQQKIISVTAKKYDVSENLLMTLLKIESA